MTLNNAEVTKVRRSGGCLLVSAFFVTCTSLAHSALERGSESAFAADKKLLNESNRAADHRASTAFPANPAQHFARVESARKMLRGGNCEGAVLLLEKAAEEYGDQGDLWGLLGKCRGQLGDFQPAVEAYKKALALGFTPWDLDLDLNPNDMMIEIAGFYAELGNSHQALAWLQRGLNARFDERPDLINNLHFTRLHNDKRFALLAGQPPPGEGNRDEEWRYDIEFLRRQVALLHSDPDHNTPAVELEQMLVNLSAAVPTLSDEQVAARTDLFIGALGAGHDLFWPVNARLGAMIPFALKLYWFTDGLYIIDAYDPSLIGHRIDAFGDTPATEAYETIANAFPGDNDMQAKWMVVRHLSQPHTLEALGIIKDADTASLTVTSPAGHQFSLAPERRPFTPMTPALAAPPDVATPLYLRQLNRPFWTQHIEALNALYVQVNTLTNGEEESFEQFSERVMREASGPYISHLIVDMRHSPGGNGYLSPPLLRSLIHFSASSEKGELYVIIGRNTFSASQNLITDLDRIANPIFVGEPSGSRPNALSESGHFRLPFSRLSGMLSSQLHQHSWPEDHRIWIAPDVPVGLSAEDYFAGVDPAIRAIEALIKHKSPSNTKSVESM